MTPGRTVRRLATEADVASAARDARDLALACGLSGVEAQHVATAVSEVALNAIKYAREGAVELARSERAGRRGLTVTVRDAGPGIVDLEAAMRDGVSTGGTLGLGLPGARRLMDDFTIESGPAGTVIAMARWAGGLLATSLPAAYEVREGTGGVALAQPFRNGLLLGVAAGARADDVVRSWRARAWQAPTQLADACRAALDPAERLGCALASVSALDGRLTWLRAGEVGCVLLRDAGAVTLHPPAGPALGRDGGGLLRAATVDLRRDDVLVMAAGVGGDPDREASVRARFARGALEPRRPVEGVERRSTMEEP